MLKPKSYQKSYDSFVSDMQGKIIHATDDTKWVHMPHARVLEVERLTLILRLEEIAALKRIAEYLKIVSQQMAP